MAPIVRPLGLPVLFEDSRAPLTTDDRSIGAQPGSRWLWGLREWWCRDANIGAAVWQEMAATAAAAGSSVTLTAGTGLTGGGDLSANRTIALANTAIVPGAYGSATAVATFAADQQGRLTAAGSATITPAGIGAQPVDATLTALAAPVTAADRLPYFTGVDTAAMAIFTSFARTLTDDTTADQARVTLGLAPHRNYCENPSFDVWQTGTSFALASNVSTPLADRWKTLSAGTSGRTFSRQSGFAGAAYCMRMQRDSGTTSVAFLQLWHHIPVDLVRRLAGRTITISADVEAGANYSGGVFSVGVYTGTAGGETLAMSGTGIGFPTGGVLTSAGNMGAPGAAARLGVSAAVAVPSTALDMAVRMYWAPTGTAGAADYVNLTNVQIEVASVATAFLVPDLPDVIRICRRYLRKSFDLSTTPAQNVGPGTGEHRFPATGAGAATNRLGSIRFGDPMRAVPALTFYNPAAANAQVRDLTAAADCSVAATANATADGFEVTCTGAATTTAGNDLGVHWLADARL